MTERDFIYWLQGFFELADTNNLSEKQVQIIRDHLALTMIKVTPDRSNPSPLVWDTKDITSPLVVTC